MTPQQMVGIGVRLFAVWLLLSSVRYLSSVPVALARTGEFAERVYQSYIIGGAFLVAAVLLWLFPMFVAHKLVPRTHHDDRLSLSAFQAARVGCALIGLWLFAQSSYAIVWLFMSSLMITVSGSVIDAMPSESRIELAVSVVELAFSIALIARSRYFAQLALSGQSDET